MKVGHPWKVNMVSNVGEQSAEEASIEGMIRRLERRHLLAKSPLKRRMYVRRIQALRAELLALKLQE